MSIDLLSRRQMLARIGRARRMTCLMRRHDDIEAAIRLLTDRFCGTQTGRVHAQPLPDTARPCAKPVPRPQRRQGDGLFLWRLESPMLWHLNPLGQAIWTLLEQPQSPAELAAVLTTIFVDVPQDRIAADAAAFLGAAQQAGLVPPA